MKKIIIGSYLFVALFASSHAQSITWQPVTSGTYSNSSTQQYQDAYSSSTNGNYQGSSGAQYQYDLNNPVDRNRYSTDLDAQRRDSLNVDSGSSLDKLRGQSDGGYLPK
jgi:hypothetical protein